MDLPLTNDLVHLHQQYEGRSRCRSCLLLCSCLLATLVAAFLLVDLLALDQRPLRSQIILFHEEIFPEEKVETYSLAGQEAPVVPEYTAVFDVEKVEFWGDNGAGLETEGLEDLEDEDETSWWIGDSAESRDGEEGVLETDSDTGGLVAPGDRSDQLADEVEVPTEVGDGGEFFGGFGGVVPEDGSIWQSDVGETGSAVLKMGDSVVVDDAWEEEVNRAERESCYDVARKVSEPYTQEYVSRAEAVSISGPVWADYNWPGMITEEDIGSARSTGDYKSFKILGGKLYRSASDQAALSEEESRKMRAFVNAVLLAMSLFDIPDVDFILDLGDHQRVSTSPALQFAFDKALDNPKGFTVPDLMAIEGALGPIQLETLFQCLDWRYPVADRAMTAVVHGAHASDLGQYLIEEARSNAMTSDYEVCSEGNCALTSYYSGEPGLANSKPNIPLTDGENLNQYAFVVDTDQDSQSSEFSNLMKQNTPILKQDTQFPGYYWSHVIEDRPVQYFRRDGSDFLDSFEGASNLRNTSPTLYHRSVVEKMRDFSRTHLSHFGIARATAYALTVYANKIAWIPGHEFGYVEISSDNLQMDTLPEGFKRLRIT